MNTQLKSHPTADTTPTSHFSRPQPAWTDEMVVEAPMAAPRRTRWWIAAVAAGLATAASVTAIVVSDGSSPEPVPAVTSTERPAFDSPGGNSLNIPPIVRSPAPTDTVQRPAFDSPGGNSLNIPVAPERTSPAEAPSGFDSPGGNSLDLD
jgi:hypothetical protein